jgi:signal transduction histidine kinase
VVAASTSEPLPEDTEKRMLDFTDLVATAIANADSRAELTASRARVIAAADESRRRIERDLHDGAQQRLVALGLNLREAEAIAPPELKAHLSHAADDLTSVVEDLQELTRGLHPAIRSKGGLYPALKTLARRSSVPVELNLRTDQPQPQPIEAAVYYIVSEALTNAAKHSHASIVHIDLTADDTAVRLCIRDDGIGGADPGHGSGLIGLKDRVAALGGDMQITSPVGRGTSLLITIPAEDG